jgi:hypothetical protein
VIAFRFSTHRRIVAVVAALLLLVLPNSLNSSEARASGAPAVQLPEAQTFASANTFFDVVPGGNGVILTGFSGDVRVVLGVDVGLLRIDGTLSNSNGTLTVGSSSVSVPLGYRDAKIGAGGAGLTEVAIEGAIDSVNAVLAELQFSRAQGSSTLNVSAVKAGGGGSTVAYDPNSERYYEYVSSSVTWVNARCAAKFVGGSYDVASTRFDNCEESNLVPRTFNGLTGYLATVTTGAENRFVFQRAGSADAWIGGTDSRTTRLAGSASNIAPTDQVWRWSDGPEAGLVFWVSGCGDGSEIVCATDGTSGAKAAVSASASYGNWNSGEPNGIGGDLGLNKGSEGALQLLAGLDSTGRWNDLDVNSQRLPFIVEYGGLAGETVVEQVERTVALSVAQNGPPTGVTATAGSGLVTVSWTAATVVTGSLTNYTVTATPGGATCVTTSTSCQVSGLTNGTSYTFVVRAAFAGSADRDSNASASVTPVFVAPPPAPASSPPAPASSPPAPAVVIPPRVLPQVLSTPAPVVGPVVSGNATTTPPSAPTALVGGRPLAIQTQVTDPNTMSLRAGVLNIGMNVASGQGSVSSQGGTTELQVRNGGSAGLTGSGLLPRSTVQVFMPLQGSNSREIARIPVDATGSFSGDAIFGATPSEAPLPIGRHVLQMVTVDENRQQTVVEMTVNIAQPPPAPELNRSTNERPALLLGQSIATNGGQPEAVTVTPIPDQNQATIQGDGWSMAVGVEGDGGGVSSGEGGAEVTFVRDQGAVVSGEGFMPGTRADVWLFSDPTLLGTVDIDENGEFNGTVNIDGNVVTVGEHTLQLQGVGEDGFVRAANLGVTVSDEAPALTEESSGSFLWLLLAALGVVGAAAGGTWWYRRALR